MDFGRRQPRLAAERSSLGVLPGLWAVSVSLDTRLSMPTTWLDVLPDVQFLHRSP